jgi:hypothetical protein
VKRSGRDESIQVVIHICMKVMLGISLYSYPYVTLAKALCLSHYCLCLLFNKIAEESRTCSSWGGKKVVEEAVGGGEVEIAQTMYAHLNKFKKKKRMS